MFASKLRLLAAAAGACCAMAASMPANAYVYAVSSLNLQNLQIQYTGATVTPGNYTFNLSNTAAMNGPAVSSSAACNSLGFPACSTVSPVLDAAAINAPGSTLLRTNNNFNFLGTDSTNSYSGSDSVITNAALVQGVPTNIRQIAESLLNINGFAQANSEIQSNTLLTQTVTIAGGANLNVSFSADPDQSSQIAGLLGQYLSQSNLNSSLTLTRNGGGSVTWKPQGTFGNQTTDNDCVVVGLAGVACVETADGASLNFNTSTGSNPGMSTNSFETGSIFANFGILVTGLLDGTYTLALNTVTSTSIIRAVPEPGTTALVGLALAGLGLASRRRKAGKA